MSDNIRVAPGAQSDPIVSTDETTLNSVAVQVPHTRILLGGRGADGGFWSASNAAPVYFANAQHVIVDSGALTATVDTSALATAANQATANGSLASLVSALDVALSTRASESTLSALNTKIPSSPATDRATAGGPFAVRLSDGSAFYAPPFAVSQSGSWSVSVSSLPALATGANTIGAVTGPNATALATESTLAALNTKTPSLGQAVVGSSSPVVLPSAQDIVAYAGVGGSTGHIKTTFSGGTPPYSNSTLVTTGVSIKSSAGMLFGYQIYNNTGVTIFLLFFNATSTQSNGASPLGGFHGPSLATGTLGTTAVTPKGRHFSTGIWMQASSTVNTLTALTGGSATTITIVAVDYE